MSFISVFDVLGPNMIGPSSSHTAGAAVIAYLAHKMIAPPLKKVDFTLYGSFAKTYHGHGTDRALENLQFLFHSSLLFPPEFFSILQYFRAIGKRISKSFVNKVQTIVHETAVL